MIVLLQRVQNQHSIPDFNTPVKSECFQKFFKSQAVLAEALDSLPQVIPGMQVTTCQPNETIHEYRNSQHWAPTMTFGESQAGASLAFNITMCMPTPNTVMQQ